MADKHLRDFGRSLPMSLLRAREAVMKKFIPSLKEHDLSPQQWRVVRALQDEDELEFYELSERCYLLKPSLSRIVRNLEARQLIERKVAENDQRRAVINLTDDGRELFAQVAPKSIERYDYIADKFGSGKLELLYELLDELVDKIDGGEDDHS